MKTVKNKPENEEAKAAIDSGRPYAIVWDDGEGYTLISNTRTTVEVAKLFDAALNNEDVGANSISSGQGGYTGDSDPERGIAITRADEQPAQCCGKQSPCCGGEGKDEPWPDLGREFPAPPR